MRTTIVRAGLLAALAVGPARAADHLDGPVVKADPAADITDLYAWIADTQISPIL